jgi:23S rRNA U2552 (ribose-2'-O)-methylase RlmE/FtsJ
MFKKSPKNCFKPVFHTSTPGTCGSSESDSHKHTNGPFLSYYNHFLLPQVGILKDSCNEYIPLPISIEHLSKNDSSSDAYQKQCNDKIDRVYVSSSVYSHLCDIKAQIEKYQDAWDNIKKFTNPYEYIHTNISGNKTNISKLRPLSRSFYKMIEIIKNHTFLSQLNHTIVPKPDTKMGINTFHLAEGPGGFIEAISYLRGQEFLRVMKEESTKAVSTSTACVNTILPDSSIQILKRNTELHDEVMKDLEQLRTSRRIFESQKITYDNSGSGGGSGGGNTQVTYANDRYYGMTLINDDPICPGWKKTRAFLENHQNVVIETGADKTGNLISLDNFMHCAAKYQNKMNIITADGGFDFSVDFNNQENMATQLILCEVFYALAMQKQGGTFILKIFDVFHKPTVDILYLLCYYYNSVSIMKPHTSRIANSEKYVVCQGFKISDSSKIVEQFSELFESLSSCPERILSIIPQDHDLYFLNKIEEMNAMVSFQQIENITSTLSIITNHRNTEKLDHYKKSNVNKCIAWCEHYDIPYHVHHASIQSTNIFLNRSCVVIGSPPTIPPNALTVTASAVMVGPTGSTGSVMHPM